MVSTTDAARAFVVAVTLAVLHLTDAGELIRLVRRLLGLLASLVAATVTLSRLVPGVLRAQTAKRRLIGLTR